MKKIINAGIQQFIVKSENLSAKKDENGARSLSKSRKYPNKERKTNSV